jgi:ribosomal protein S1
MMNEEPRDQEMSLAGQLIEGRVEAVFRWGVIVDANLSRPGLIDALYIDDGDDYKAGQNVSCYLDSFDEQKDKFILRPPGQIPLAERLRRARGQ